MKEQSGVREGLELARNGAGLAKTLSSVRANGHPTGSGVFL